MSGHTLFVLVFAVWALFSFAAGAVFAVFNGKYPALAVKLPREKMAGSFLAAVLLIALVPHVEELFEPQSIFVQGYLLWIAAAVLFLCIVMYADFIFARALAVAMIFGAYLALREGFGFAVPLYPFVAVCAFLFGLTGIVIGAKPVWLRVWLEKTKEKTWLRYGSCIYFVLTGLCALIALILNEII